MKGRAAFLKPVGGGKATENAMLAHELMTTDIAEVAPDTPVREIIMIMRSRDTGAVPVCKNGQIVGIVTDRDIVMRLLSDAADIVGAQASDIMSGEVVICHGDQPVNKIAAIMGDHQIRRLPVISRESILIGMITIGDIARDASEHMAGEALGEIVEKR